MPKWDFNKFALQLLLCVPVNLDVARSKGIHFIRTII